MKWITKDGKRFPVHNERNFVNSRNLPVAVFRDSKRPDSWTMMVKGSGHHTKPFGEQPLIGIKRQDALDLKKVYNMKSTPHGYEGEIPEDVYHLSGEGKAFVGKKKPDDFSKYKGTVREDQVNKISDEKLNEIIKEIERGYGGDILKKDLPYLKFRLRQRVRGKEESKPEPKQEKDFTIVKTLHNQLTNTKINGFPFYAYTGIKPTAISETDLNLKAPKNPNGITSINVHYNKGTDEYDLRFQKGSKIETLDGIQWDNLGDVIVDRMGVR